MADAEADRLPEMPAHAGNTASTGARAGTNGGARDDAGASPLSRVKMLLAAKKAIVQQKRQIAKDIKKETRRAWRLKKSMTKLTVADLQELMDMKQNIANRPTA